jgi:hypothetical protein
MSEAIHQTIRVEAKFDGKTNNAWTQTFTNLKMAKHDYAIVRQILYDGTDGVQYPISVSSDQFGRDFACFMSTNSQIAGPNITTVVQAFKSDAKITNNSDAYINGNCNFSCQQGGNTISTLNGTLMIIIEIVRLADKKH